MTAPPPAVLHLGPRGVLAAWRPAEAEPRVAAVQAACRRWYEPALGPVHSAARRSEDGTVLAAFDVVPLPEVLPEVVVWGQPLGEHGPLSAEALRRVLDRPIDARALRGRFVIAGPHGAGLRLVTSSDLAAVLRRAAGPAGVAVATKGAAALLAAGAPLRLATDHVAEYVMFDYVLGDDELLAGVEVVTEAAVVERGTGGLAATTYWPVAERFTRSGAPTTARGLRSALAEHLLPIARAGEVCLALTAGRDSVLLASVLGEHGVELPTLTMGDLASPDAAGARAVAGALGWPHALAPVDTSAGTSLRRAVTAARWDEGLQSGSDTAGPQLRWPVDLLEGRTWLTGSGGEIGRAFYWSDKVPEEDPLHLLVTGRAGHLDDDRAGRFAERVEAGLRAACAGAPQRGIEVLDVLYARGRMRKWLAAITTPPGSRAALSAYTHPALLPTLLGTPPRRRQDARLWDEALTMGPRDLAAVARAGAERSAAMRRHRSRGRRLARGAARRLRAPRLGADLQHVLDELGDDPVARGILGERWWRLAVERAPASGAHARWLWNAVAVEALARAIEDAPQERPLR